MANNHRNFDEVITDVWTLELGITDRLLGSRIRINWQVIVMPKTKIIRLPIPVATPAPIVSRTYSYQEDYATNNCADTESEKNHLPLIFGLFIASLVIFNIGYIVAQNQQNIALENARKEAIAAQNKLQAVKRCVEAIK
ncbi:hypothetical protein NIES2119_28675 [[Phormidium ambiguum] IAM M-71]|uniref:Uncharacterized protein n=1 Tax=[Phormidium ambiguum] IAM M-71 TaxID=454136 RepID=A0A1U7I5D6_9CYAN|nr:hypothetical protein [Phormidium ambiguum]OKH31453.1 hypothetical protein NIES2119_28675 [Phormidium ambiguum IAM M-71]